LEELEKVSSVFGQLVFLVCYYGHGFGDDDDDEQLW